MSFIGFGAHLVNLVPSHLKDLLFFPDKLTAHSSGVQDVDIPLKSTVQHTAVSLEVVSVVGRHRP